MTQIDWNGDLEVMVDPEDLFKGHGWLDVEKVEFDGYDYKVYCNHKWKLLFDDGPREFKMSHMPYYADKDGNIMGHDRGLPVTIGKVRNKKKEE